MSYVSIFNYANVYVKSSGVWTPVNNAYTNTADGWAKIGNIYQNINGAWTLIWPTQGIIQFTSNVTASIPPGINFADIAIVGGGGAGGEGITPHNGGGGGGGAGGVVEVFGVPVNPGDSYTISIGQGGTAPAINSGQPGGDGGSTTITGPAGTWVAYGGGGGGGFYGSGGSLGASTGGGFACADTPNVGPPIPTVAPFEGYAGEFGATNDHIDTGGGGGGAGGPGTIAYNNGIAGNGGPGIQLEMTSLWVGGGGGGGIGGYQYGAGGAGGEGGGGNSGEDGFPNTGGGGGGGGAGGGNTATGLAGNGANGIAFVRYYSLYNGAPEVTIDHDTGAPVVPTGTEVVTGTGGGGCFVGDTMVLLSDGTEKPISQIQIGDKVFNFDKSKINTVTFIEVATDADFGKLYSPDQIHAPFATINHPMYVNGVLSSVDPVQNNQWYPWFKTETLVPAKVIDGKNQRVYNLWVDGDNTYNVNGYGTTSIIGDGGILRKFVERGEFSGERASDLLFKFTSGGRDMVYGAYVLNRFAGRIDCVPLNKLLAKALRDDESKKTQCVVFGLFKLVGKIINFFG
jgi:hypothetical protein